MANDIKKPNDIFVATIKAPTASTFDLFQNGLTSDNTSFLSLEEYKQTPLVQKLFTKDDTFDEESFKQAYLLAANKYQDLSNVKSSEEFSKELEYSASSRNKPLGAKIKDNLSSYINLINPLGESYGLEGVNRRGKPLYTEEENAQSNRIWDPVNQKWLNETPESRSLFKKVFGESLVYAEWEENGTHIDPLSGEEVQHFAGERKTDEFGNYYTELLGDRELLGKKVVSLSDILTKEDSWINKYDFFDSDGFDKSGTGIAMKTAVSILPYLIPGFNTYYGAVTAAFGLASVLPTFYKSLEAIFTGEDSSIISQNATKMENWFRKFQGSKSRAGSLGFWNWETAGELAADIFGQLYQQQAAAGLAKYLTSPGATRNKLGLKLSLGYMGLISASDVYNDALQGGYDKRTAGIAALASASALYGIMNFNESTRGLGTWFLRETTGYLEDLARAPITKLAKSLYKDIETGLKDLTISGDKKSLASALHKFKTGVFDVAQDVLISPAESLWKSAIVEGVEEVSEEVIQDAVKGMIDTLSWFGFTEKQGSFGGWQNVFSREGLERYVATLVGGAAGGALFHLNIDHIEPLIKLFTNGTPKQKQVDYNLIRACLEGRGGEVIAELKRLKKIYNTNLSSASTDIDGNQVYLSDTARTLADLVTEGAIKEVEAILHFIEDEIMASFPEWKDLSDIERNIYALNLWEQTTLGQYKFDEYIKNSFSSVATELLLAKRAYEALDEKADNETKNKLKQDFNKKRAELKGFFNGNKNIEFATEFKLLQNDWIRTFLMNLDEESYAYNTYGIEDYNNLSDEEKSKIHKEYEILQNSDDSLLNKLPLLRKLYTSVLARVSPNISSYVNHEHKNEFIRKKLASQEDYENAVLEIEMNPELSEELMRKALNELDKSRMPNKLAEMLKADPLAFTITDLIDFDIATPLISKGVFELDGFNNEEIDYVKKLINDLAAFSRINYWGAEQIQKLAENVNAALMKDSTNIYANKIKELRQNNNSNDSDESPVLDVDIFGSISKVNLDKITPDLEFSKLSAVEDYMQDYVDEEIYDIFEKTYNPLLDRLAESDEYIRGLVQDYKELGANNSFLRDLLEYKESFPDLLPLLTLLEKIVNSLEKLKSKQKLQNPLIEAAKQIYSQLNGSDYGKDIFDLLTKSEISLRDVIGFSQYQLNDDALQKITSAKRSLDALLAVAQGMVSTLVGNLRIMGISELSRKMIELYQGDNETLKAQYKVIDNEDSARVFEFVKELKEKLNYIVTISNQITRDKHLADIVREKLHYEALSNYYQKLIEDESLKIKIGDEEFNLFINEHLNANVPPDEFCYLAEQEIYNELLRIKSEHPEITNDLLHQAIIDKFGENILDIDYDAETAIKKDRTENIVINNNFIAHKIAGLIHYSPKQYLQDLLDIYKDNPTAYPSFGLSLVIRQILTYLNNSKLESAFIEKIGIPADSEEIIQKVLMPNTLTVIGAPGSGKNYIMHLLSKKLKSKYSKIEAISKIQHKADDLATNLGVEKGKTIEEFLGPEIYAASQLFEEGVNKAFKIIADAKESTDTLKVQDNVTVKSASGFGGKKTYNVEIKGKTASNSDYSIAVKIDTDSDSSLSKLEVTDFGAIAQDAFSDLNGVYVIDEASFINSYVSKLLDTKAKQSGGLIILLGDQTQLGYAINSNSTHIPYNFLGIQGINTPILIGSYRANNSGKSYNCEVFRDAFLKDDILQDSENKPIPAYLSLYKNSSYPGDNAFANYFEKFPLQYNITETNFMGDLITGDLLEFTNILQQLVASNKSIAIVVDNVNENNPVYKEIKAFAGDKIKYFTPETIQGDEYDYVIGYKLAVTPGLRNADIDAQKANMLVTRARDFGLWFDEGAGLFTARGINSKLDSTIRPNTEDSTDVPLKSAIDNIEYIKSQLEVVESVKKTSEEPKNLEKEEEEISALENATSDEIDTKTEAENPAPVNEEDQNKSDTADLIKLTSQPKFADASVIHSFYTRVGMTREMLAKLKLANTESAVKAIMDLLSDSGENTDLVCFYRNWDDIKKRFYPSYKGRDITKTNGELLLKTYETFTKDLFVFWEDYDLTLVVKGERYNPNIDYSYNKVNDIDPSPASYIRVGIKIGSSFITIGRMGYNPQLEDGSPVSKTQADLYALANKGFYKEYKWKKSNLTAVKEYFKSRGLNIDAIKAVYKKGIIQYTNARAYNILDSKSNHDLFGDFLYGRLTYDLMTSLGWHFVEDNNKSDWVYDSTASEEENIQKFKTFYSKYRWEEKFDDSWVKKVYKRKWKVVRFLNSESTDLLVMLNEISDSLDLQLTKSGKFIKLFSLKQVLQGLDALTSKDPKLFDGLNAWNDRTKIAAKIQLLNDLIKAGTIDISTSIIEDCLRKIQAAFKNGNQSLQIVYSDIKPIVDYLNEKLPEYFFKTSKSDDGTFNLATVRFSKIFEQPRYYLDWSCFEEITQTPVVQSSVEEVITTEPVILQEKTTTSEPEIIQSSSPEPVSDKIKNDIFNAKTPQEIKGLISNISEITKKLKNLITSGLVSRTDCSNLLRQWVSKLRGNQSLINLIKQIQSEINKC